MILSYTWLPLHRRALLLKVFMKVLKNTAGCMNMCCVQKSKNLLATQIVCSEKLDTGNQFQAHMLVNKHTGNINDLA